MHRCAPVLSRGGYCSALTAQFRLNKKNTPDNPKTIYLPNEYFTGREEEGYFCTFRDGTTLYNTATGGGLAFKLDKRNPVKISLNVEGDKLTGYGYLPTQNRYPDVEQIEAQQRTPVSLDQAIALMHYNNVHELGFEFVLDAPETILSELQRSLDRSPVQKQHHLLVMAGDIEPIPYGPYDSFEETVEAAREYRRNSQNDLDDGLFYMTIDDNGHPQVENFTGGVLDLECDETEDQFWAPGD